MIKVFEAQHLSEAHLLCGLLQADGISAEVRGHDLFSTLGMGSGVPGVLPTVWISDPSNSDKALALISQFTKGNTAISASPSWKCPQCQEIHETQFSSCWKCGAQKPVSASA